MKVEKNRILTRKIIVFARDMDAFLDWYDQHGIDSQHVVFFFLVDQLENFQEAYDLVLLNNWYVGRSNEDIRRFLQVEKSDNPPHQILTEQSQPIVVDGEIVGWLDEPEIQEALNQQEDEE